MTFGAGRHATFIVKIKGSNRNVIIKSTIFFKNRYDKNNLPSVSDADREIPTLGTTDNAGNEVNLDSGIIRLPEVEISWSASETENKLYLSPAKIKNQENDEKLPSGIWIVCGQIIFRKCTYCTVFRQLLLSVSKVFDHCKLLCGLMKMAANSVIIPKKSKQSLVSNCL